ncbi:MAG: small ribosomal subunit biogenesis GTPase RsgA [Pseudomonadales bacterium]|nr:small ribosomal subunit biogenesis GTPase RsgA [Pseudomonadales bacterium]MCP5171000.1 small ribosomal subunit biogenesis GTPase RsgA [Pseudomonadales bacterium]MCP5301762.1 small ribosomal subunit biogenesis GTPase RsgA [Pseudomonadales bacterium]
MAKRRLTAQQKRRIRAKQARQQQNADTNAADMLHEESASLGPELAGTVVANYGAQADIEAQDGTITRCHLRANLEPLVTGDKITWQSGETTGVVVAVNERTSELCRPDNRGDLRPVAANIDRIVLVFAPKPEPHANLIDRYLVAAETQGIDTLLLLNKADLLDDEDTLIGLLDSYQQLGYDTLVVSAKNADSVAPLAQYLKPFTSVFVGQSGVGKSSLLNTLAPDISVAVGELSEARDKGTHTTTTSRLFHLPDGGDVIDSPGIREFGLWHMAPENVAHGFIEFRPFLGLCKFRDCQHRQEPGCAINTAVAEGRISQQRIDSYWLIVNSLISK